ncbi:dihydrodipicolinate synthase family protein [Sporomusa acidovorans]|uniref:2-dehydro-3-deoxy-D-pentonate aldolase YjhH n=1 Tax=Sporomusa acidovorans (strain ATCC 49682 / DSM 3132 / Mol) TaxID=1123286 RepID=A0ABZ3IVU5_SPOA4|nr:dihydrodipicolinate synthase family protein [Sporomusa acidovorans]OZC23896.1 putative 2-keto-3-deoxy-galactonate aldolase YagE [Sporomusa acidovorans DSM 3132]SDF54080.1 4-hydroxy-tetrahydrodipicolinate synthase [Sporomusa acidovorans]
MKKAQFLTPVVTAFDAHGNLDCQANKNIYDHLIAGGIDGIVVMGSTGEFFSMTMEQKKELIDIAVNHINKRTKLYIGTSCMSVDDTVALSNYAHAAGADAVMIVSPYYFKLTPASIELFYDEVASKVKADIFLYNFPDRTGHDLTPAIMLNLARRHKNIVGCKDTVTEMSHTRAIIMAMQPEFPDFVVFSGYDENFVHNILCGGGGCIGGLSNLAPELFAAWTRAINAHDFAKIEEIQHQVDFLMGLYDIGTPFIPIVKKAMMLRGIEMQDYCTLPFLRADDRQCEQLKALMRQAKLL